MQSEIIRIRGARQNNLQSIDLDLPLGKFIVITGPSGSGKSSLAFDTIYAEGQRRYVETFSPYTRQFLDRMDKPLADAIEGIPPAIAIEQSNSIKSTRSTVGTITEILDYLKLLMPRMARAFCPQCSRPVGPESATRIVQRALEAFSSRVILVTFPVSLGAIRGASEFFEFLRSQGYLRIWWNNAVHRTDAPPAFETLLPESLLVIQDRLTAEPTNHARLTEAIETSLRLGKDRCVLIEKETPHPFSSGWHCAHCDRDIRPPSPGLFSFSNPLGACPACKGFGRIIGIDYDRALPDKSLSIADGVIKPFQSGQAQECQNELLRACARQKIDVHIPFQDLSKVDQEFVLSGEENGKETPWYGVKGFFDRMSTKAYKMHVRVFLSRYRSYLPCPTCGGTRYQPDTLNYRLPLGKDLTSQNLTLPEIAALPIHRLAPLIESLAPTDASSLMLRNQVASRLRYLEEVGLGYLTLDRPSRTLSGGEIERVNLTTCLGASLVNTLFVLDEPSVGLHPRDVQRLLQALRALCNKGNTLLVVEHEEAIIRASDMLVDIGPGRGIEGGRLVYAGPIDHIPKNSLTGDYLARRKCIEIPKNRRSPQGFIDLYGIRHRNFQDVDIRIPLGVFCCVTGVSGSGKSSLVNDVLYQNLSPESPAESMGSCRAMTGEEEIEEVILVDQSPLTRSTRSTPALYLGVFDAIRELFGTTPEAIAQGFSPGWFSFNSGQGRCERCGGLGFEKVEMQFLSDLFLRCPECEGRRYQPAILKIFYRGKNIHQVLQMTVREALEFFAKDEIRLTGPLHLLSEVGLEYLQLGQPTNLLSGGESQRLKLVKHLAESRNATNLLILDEPTTGLHFDDIAQLIRVFQRLVKAGNHLIVIEHNLEIIKCADWIVDLGPEAGERGGRLVAEGPPEVIARSPESHTGRYLRSVLSPPPPCPPQSHVPSSTRSSSRSAAPIISIRGAREHNLKNVNVNIPRNTIVVVTGLSGSGKSTLAFDVLFAEGQRRFLDSMSPYARQFVEQLEKPDVDQIEGLPPSVAIEQRVTRGGGKSTVATVTEIYHFLRLLFAKVGTQHCPQCGVAVEKNTVTAVAARATQLLRQGPLQIYAPVVKARKGFHTEVARWAERQGFSQLLVDGTIQPVVGFKKLERFKEHNIDVLVDQLSSKEGDRTEAAIRQALKIGKGTARLRDARKMFHLLSTKLNCPSCERAFEGLDPRLFSFNSPHGWCPHCRGFGEIWPSMDREAFDSQLEADLAEERRYETLEQAEAHTCPVCAGARLNETARHVRLQGFTITDIANSSAEEAFEIFTRLRFSGEQQLIAKDIIAEMLQRLRFLNQVGLDYLSLDRSAKTLSGGESQRIRLAAQLGSNLRGVLYVLDEPTIGLHARDNARLLEALKKLADQGNSLLIVEHDEDTMRQAAHIIDLGPGAGRKGGQIVAEGSFQKILKNPHSPTGQALKTPILHPLRGQRRSLNDCQWLELEGATKHNLCEVDVRIPLGRLTVVSGVSGSGKSTLLRGVLVPAIRQLIGRSKKCSSPPAWKSLRGTEYITAVLEVDQSPIGKTSRSTPATYIKLFDTIRTLFAQLPASRMRGYTASRFSFNNVEGRCSVCEGQGVIKLEMNFLPPSYMPCEDCQGKRYNPQTLEVLYNEKSIGDIMEMTIEQAVEFFAAHPKIRRPLDLLIETGLGYLQLGQPSPTLSGGEAQRIKLVEQLASRSTPQAERLRTGRPGKSILYILEEPTIGLHAADVSRLIHVFHHLVDEGGTVVVIEHHLDIIGEADYLLDMGPEAGADGGRVVAAGSPEDVRRSKQSRTAPFLKSILRRRHL